MTDAPFPILYEDNHLLAVLKPADLPTMGVTASQPSLLTEAKQYLKRKYNKPGNVYLGIVSRLDAPVTGVVLLARTSKAAARLTEQFRNRLVEKTYWALVSGVPQPRRDTLCDWLRKDERQRRMQIVPPESAGSQQAVLTFRVVDELKFGSLVEIELETGRKHQIRVQLSGLGHPILGDRKYGSREPFPQGIALHARRLRLTHPVRNIPLDLLAPLPKYWRRFGVRF